MKAVWENNILAESDETIVIENNHYFPASSLNTLQKATQLQYAHGKAPLIITLL